VTHSQACRTVDDIHSFFHLLAVFLFLVAPCLFLSYNSDGQVICDNEDDPDSCHGFLLAVYANDLSGNKAQFFRRYQRDRPEPVTILSETDLEGSEFLKHAHQQLMDYHLLYKQDAPYTGLQATEMLQNVKPPQFAMLSTWDSAIPWAGGGWHGWTEPSNIDLAQMPFVDHQIYLVNEAYSAVQAWAEGTIKLADEILEDYFGIARPWNFTVTEQNQIVRQTNSQECTAVATASGGDAGSAGEAAAAVLCFTGNAKVSMADGTYKPLQDVQVGDKILTGGPAGQVGIVTQALRHPVHKVVTLAKLVTEDHGELLGTEDHPVMQNDQWINFGRIMGKAKVQVQIVEQFVDTLYNLEVDGHLVDDDIDTKGKSLHAYIVNGVVASGLGDNVRLNLQYPRQTAWKLRAEQTRTSNMVG
jgi:Hint-domain